MWLDNVIEETRGVERDDRASGKLIKIWYVDQVRAQGSIAKLLINIENFYRINFKIEFITFYTRLNNLI